MPIDNVKDLVPVARLKLIGRMCTAVAEGPLKELQTQWDAGVSAATDLENMVQRHLARQLKDLQ